MLFAGFGSGSHLSIPVPRPNVFRRSFAAFEPLSLPCPAQTCQKMRCFLQKNKICARIGIFAPPLAATRNPGKKKSTGHGGRYATNGEITHAGEYCTEATTVWRQGRKPFDLLGWVRSAPGGGRAQAVWLAWLGSECAWRRDCLTARIRGLRPAPARDFLP